MAEKTPGGGLLDSLAKLAATLVAVAYTRLELLSSDLEEEREHLFSRLTSMLVAMFCLGVGLVFVAVLIAAVFWDSHRLLVLAVLAGTFLTAGLAAWRHNLRQARAKPVLFSASLSELSKDSRQLVPRS